MKECSHCRYCFPDEINHCPTDGSKLKMSIQGDTVLDGRYQLDRRLGQGGMGIVFQGRHIFLKTTFAIKVILPDLVGNDPMLVTRFRQEAMVAARMRHQNLVNVTDFGVVHGMPYLVMEMVVGRSLHEVLAKEGRMPPLRALEVMEAVCAGVGAAHKQGVVHRDLKPLNIMLMNGVPISQGVKILDFGLAKIKSGELLGSFVAAQTTGLMGSPSYMAPELWSDDEPDARADVYSLGIILFQMLSGEVPFRGSTIPSIMKKHLTQPPPSFSEQGVIVPKEIEAVVKKALAKSRDDRYASVEDLAADLEEAVSSLSTELDHTIPQLAGFDMRTMPFPEMTSEQTLAERQRQVEDEVEQLAREFQEAQMRADEARQRAEDASRRKTEEDVARKRAEEEAERKRQEEEAARLRAEEARRKLEEEEAARRAEEEEAERQRQQEVARQRAEEEAARKRAADEAVRLAREIAEVQQRAEEARLRADEEARLRSEEEAARRRAEEEARKLAAEVAETKLRAEEARQRAEVEARQQAQAEAQRLRVEQEEAKKRAEEEIRKRKEEEEARQLAMSEANRLSKEVSEAQRRADEAGQRAQEEAERRAAEEAARRKAEEEARRLAQEVEEAQLRVEEARKRVEEARRQAEVESQKHREELAAATSLRQQADSGSQLAPTPGMDATIASIPPPAEVRPMDTIAQLNMLGATPDIHSSIPSDRLPSLGGAGVAEAGVQQSYPSLQGSLHTQSSLGTIPDLNAAARSKKMMAIIGALVLLVFVVGGIGVALVLWRSSGTTNSPDKPVSPANSNGNTEGPVKPLVKTEMVKIEAGTFQMGRSDIDQNSTSAYELNQYPAHPTPVSAFFMDPTEVSNSEYAAFVSETKHTPPSYWTDAKPSAGQEQWPVTNVSLADAVAFAQWRSKRDNTTYRLPSEAEWEFAARNGSQGDYYPWGNEWRDNCANVGSNSLRPVGSYPACGSKSGVLDLIGNVWEWTSTKAAPYPGADQLQHQFRQEGQIIRGGSYLEDFKGADAITATRRSVVLASAKEATIGFRLVRPAS